MFDFVKIAVGAGGIVWNCLFRLVSSIFFQYLAL